MLVLLVAAWTLGGLTDTRTVVVVVLALASIPAIGACARRRTRCSEW